MNMNKGTTFVVTCYRKKNKQSEIMKCYRSTDAQMLIIFQEHVKNHVLDTRDSFLHTQL